MMLYMPMVGSLAKLEVLVNELKKVRMTVEKLHIVQRDGENG